MKNNLCIRSVLPDDFAQWKVLWHAYNQFYNRPSFPDEITRNTWERFLNSDEPVYALVAEREGKIVGLAHYLFHLSTIQLEKSCYLQDLFTCSEVRQQGIATSLITAVYEKAKIAKAGRVYWQTKEDNLIARRLYDKFAVYSGFIIYGYKFEEI